VDPFTEKLWFSSAGRRARNMIRSGEEDKGSIHRWEGERRGEEKRILNRMSCVKGVGRKIYRLYQRDHTKKRISTGK